MALQADLARPENRRRTIYGEIQRFKAKKPVPVLAHLVGIATSGAYYAAMAFF